MIIKSDLEMCKKDIEACIGRKVKLKSNGGRRRTIIREGVVVACYPNVFMVRCVRQNNDTPETVSYSYVDVLTQAVEIAVEPLNADEIKAEAERRAAEEAAKESADDADATDGDDADDGDAKDDEKDEKKDGGKKAASKKSGKSQKASKKKDEKKKD